ncbi:hypothetical protein ACSBR1_007670 [Camellia fascicularis]
MTIGIMEVLLVGARGLKNNEFFGGGIDPYILIQYKSQEHKSSVTRGQGGNPVWNEKFTFSVEYPSEEEDERYKLILNIMDKDTFSADDYLGQATIYMEDLLALGVENGNAKLHPLKYSVVSPDQNYCGEIQVGVTFTPKVQKEEEAEEEEFGGWKESGGIDPYVLIQYKSQEHKSSVTRGQGGNLVWNEKFTFSVEYPSEEEDERYKLILNIMDKDTFSADDYLGQATIYLEDLLALGVENGNAKLHPLKYSVVSPDQNYCGEIQVGVTFTPKVQEEEEAEEEEFGGWKESDY